MPAGASLINQVASVLPDHPGGAVTATVIRNRLPGAYSVRAVRYAIAALVREGRAQRRGQQGPVYAASDKNA